jgi:hypothetical protein
MDKFSVYYALAIAFAAAGLLVEDLGDGEVTFWSLIVLGLIAILGAIWIGLSAKRK